MKSSISMIIQEALIGVERETTNTINSLKDSVRLVKLKIIEYKLKEIIESKLKEIIESKLKEIIESKLKENEDD